jgi:hypothetical protein
MPVMQEPEAVDISIFLCKLTNFAGLLGGPYWPLMKLSALKAFTVACTYGINSHIAMAVAQYGILQRRDGKFEKAFFTASIAAEMLNKISYRNGDARAKVGMVIHSA